ncbi:tensin-4 [Amia ocellicauda]|uniref:tensin-4 n=1 Tax=Amia ocellicauda TaxID=2972642 RepID=UPI003463D3C9
MRSTAEEMSQVIPRHVLRVGQTICMSSKEEVLPLGRALSPGPFQGCHSLSKTSCQYPSESWARHPARIVSPCSEGSPGGSDATECSPDSPTLDISLNNLNQLILELDPSFEPLPLHGKTQSPHTPLPWQYGHSPACSPEEDVSRAVLVPRGCPSQSQVSQVSQSIPIPTHPRMGSSCSPSGSLVFSSSPTATSGLPPLPLSRSRPSGGPMLQHTDTPLSVSLGTPAVGRHRASAASLLSTSPGSDTSYMLGSTHSLLSEDSESSERRLFSPSGWSSQASSPYPQSPGPHKPFFSDHSLDRYDSRALAQQPPSGLSYRKGPHHHHHLSPPRPIGQPSSCPPSVAGSMADIPTVLVNGSPPHPQSELTKERPSSCGVAAVAAAAQRQTLRRTCKASSTSSLNGQCSSGQPSMKFVMDTSQFWFRPQISREEADALLRDQEPGAFVIRDSTSYRGAFGLAMKVHEVPPNSPPTSRTGEGATELVRHYLIESSAKGVRLKGAAEEPFFGSLSALVFQHAITPFALPCKLRIPSPDVMPREDPNVNTSAQPDGLRPGAACNFLYLNSVNTETLTGPCAVEKAVSMSLEKETLPSPTIVNLKVSPKGVTLTDVQRKLFFRRHYPAHLLSHCGEDPKSRTWQKEGRKARIFGFVAKGGDATTENVCHLFAEYDSLQPPSVAIEHIRAILGLQSLQ